MFPFFLQMSILFCFFAEKEIIVNYYGLSKADFWVSYISRFLYLYRLWNTSLFPVID